MKRIFTIIAVLSLFLGGRAQDIVEVQTQTTGVDQYVEVIPTQPQSSKGFKERFSERCSAIKQTCMEKDIFNHLDFGFAIGTGGLGFEFSSPMTRWARLRLGYAWFPHMTVPMYFDLSTYGGSVDFEVMQEAANKYLGFDIQQNVRMNGKPLAHSLRLLVDVYPFQDKKQWRVTAGFMWGPKKIATAVNGLDEMQTTLGVMLYNKVYDFVMETDFFEKPIYGDFFLDPQVADMLKDKFAEFGYLGVGIGTYKDDGRPCILEPDAKGKMTANMFINNFCPYLGVGYDKQFGPEQRWKLGVDLGFLIWGGSPSIITEALKVDSQGNFILDANGKKIREEVDLVKDVTDIIGRPGTYVDITSHLKVGPMLNLKLSYTLF